MPVPRKAERRQPTDGTFQETESLTDHLPGLGVFLLHKDKHSRKRRRHFIQLGRSQKAKVVKLTYGVLEGVCRAITPSEHMDLLDAVVRMHKRSRRRQAREHSGAALSEDAKALLWDCEDDDSESDDVSGDEEEEDDDSWSGTPPAKEEEEEEKQRGRREGLREEEQERKPPTGGGMVSPPPAERAGDRLQHGGRESGASGTEPPPGAGSDLADLIRGEATRIQLQQVQALHDQRSYLQPSPSAHHWPWLHMEPSVLSRGAAGGGQSVEPTTICGAAAAELGASWRLAYGPASGGGSRTTMMYAGDGMQQQQQQLSSRGPSSSLQHRPPPSEPAPAGGAKSGVPTFDYLPIGRPLDFRTHLQAEDLLQQQQRQAHPLPGARVAAHPFPRQGSSGDRPPYNHAPPRHAAGRPGPSHENNRELAGLSDVEAGGRLLKSLGGWPSTGPARPPHLQPPGPAHGAGSNRGRYMDETTGLAGSSRSSLMRDAPAMAGEVAFSTVCFKPRAEEGGGQGPGRSDGDEWRQHQAAARLDMLLAQSTQGRWGPQQVAAAHHAQQARGRGSWPSTSAHD